MSRKIRLTKKEIDELVNAELQRRVANGTANVRKIPFVKASPYLTKGEKQILIDHEVSRREEIRRRQKEEKRRKAKQQQRIICVVFAVLMVGAIIWLATRNSVTRQSEISSLPSAPVHTDVVETLKPDKPSPTTTPVPTLTPTSTPKPTPTPTPTPAPTASKADDSPNTIIARYNRLDPPTKISGNMVKYDDTNYSPISKNG